MGPAAERDRKVKTLINVGALVLFVLFGSVVPAAAQSEQDQAEQTQTVQSTAQSIPATVGGEIMERWDSVMILLALYGFWWKLDTKVEGARTSLDEKVEGARKELDGKIEDARKELDGKIEGARTSLDRKIEGAIKELDGKIEGAIKASDDAHAGIVTRIEDIKVDIATANGKLSILEHTFVKEYVEATRSKNDT